MININIDVQDTINEFALSESQVTSMCNAASEALVLEIQRNWIEAAKRELHSTRNNYIKGLIVKNEGVGNNSITLVGPLNNMLEDGAEGFDMKANFMKSAKVKFTKSGNWYLTIPFRFATPGASGEGESFDDVMPQEIYDIVKDKTPQITDGGEAVQSGSGLKYNEIPVQFQAPTTRESVTIQSINKVFDAYTSKTALYEGLVRNQKSYEEATQGTYGTFRRVSEYSSPRSWIFPGLTARNLADQAISNTDEDIIVNNVVDKILSEFGF